MGLEEYEHPPALEWLKSLIIIIIINKICQDLEFLTSGTSTNSTKATQQTTLLMRLSFTLIDTFSANSSYLRRRAASTRLPSLSAQQFSELCSSLLVPLAHQPISGMVNSAFMSGPVSRPLHFSGTMAHHGSAPARLATTKKSAITGWPTPS